MQVCDTTHLFCNLTLHHMAMKLINTNTSGGHIVIQPGSKVYMSLEFFQFHFKFFLFILM